MNATQHECTNVIPMERGTRRPRAGARALTRSAQPSEGDGVYLHPSTLHDQDSVELLEMTTGMRAFWVGGRRAQLLPLPPPHRRRAADGDHEGSA